MVTVVFSFSQVISPGMPGGYAGRGSGAGQRHDWSARSGGSAAGFPFAPRGRAWALRGRPWPAVIAKCRSLVIRRSSGTAHGECDSGHCGHAAVATPWAAPWRGPWCAFPRPVLLTRSGLYL